MVLRRTSVAGSTQWVCCAVVLVFAAAAFASYGINMVLWKDATDYGWRAMYDSGPKVVDEVFGKGWQAGLRPGDTILFINGRSYETFDELFFEVRNPDPGFDNVYTIIRNGEPVDIHITNGVLGFVTVLKRSGPLFAVGLFYIFVGVLVYLMKPRARESWIFLLMTVSLGLSISYSSPSDLMRPLWLFKFRQFFDVFLPAPLIHLALVFPVRRRIVDIGKWVWTAPYLIALVIFIFYRPFSATYWDPPPHMDLINNLYLLIAVVIFILSTVLNFRRGSSPLVRVQSRMVFFGIFFGFFIPVLELLARHLWGLFLFPDPAVSFALLFTAFPLCVGYTIVRHDLFAIDATVRSTFGYALSSAAIVGVYALIVAALNLSIPATDIARSRVFTVLFAIVVVIAFRPLHERVQRLVDRRFYRVKLDYKSAVVSISNDLTSLLNLDEIIIRIIHAVRDVMFIDSAGVILLEPEVEECQALFIHDGPDETSEEKFETNCLDPKDPLIVLMKQEKRVLTIYDLEEDPKFAQVREPCTESFNTLKAVVALPLIFQDEVKGVLALGRKKSGRFYAREDIDLLVTLASQGAVAIENARLAEKMRQEYVIRTNLARYLSPQVVDQVIQNRVAVDLGGERKNVAVLISDIRDFTELTKAQPPDRLVAILNEYFTEMAGIIFDNQGSLDKYVGDAIVAVFGSLIPLENHTANAVKASIDMVNCMTQLNMKWFDEFDGFSMEIGIGIDTGEVFLGNVGSPERMEFTVLGTAVNTASQLSELARPRQVLLSEAVAAAQDGECAIRELEGFMGQLGDQRIFEVVGLNQGLKGNQIYST